MQPIHIKLLSGTISHIIAAGNYIYLAVVMTKQHGEFLGGVQKHFVLNNIGNRIPAWLECCEGSLVNE
jgi:hypothetical protein